MKILRKLLEIKKILWKLPEMKKSVIAQRLYTSGETNHRGELFHRGVYT